MSANDPKRTSPCARPKVVARVAKSRLRKCWLDLDGRDLGDRVLGAHGLPAY